MPVHTLLASRAVTELFEILLIYIPESLVHVLHVLSLSGSTRNWDQICIFILLPIYSFHIHFKRSSLCLICVIIYVTLNESVVHLCIWLNHITLLSTYTYLKIYVLSPQVNDDTVIVTANWAPTFVHTLAANPSIPNFGVTGPSDSNNDKIFTHSFVHRTHIEVTSIYLSEIVFLLFVSLLILLYSTLLSLSASAFPLMLWIQNGILQLHSLRNNYLTCTNTINI